MKAEFFVQKAGDASSYLTVHEYIIIWKKGRSLMFPMIIEAVANFLHSFFSISTDLKQWHPSAIA